MIKYVWEFVKEIYPYFTAFCLVVGLLSYGKAILAKLNGDEEAINKVLVNITSAFLLLHLGMCIVLGVWYLTKGIGTAGDKLVEKVFLQDEPTKEEVEQAVEEAIQVLKKGRK